MIRSKKLRGSRVQLLVAAAAAASTFMHGHVSKAASATWVGGTDGSWIDGTNWNPTSAPGATSGNNNGDTALFNTASSNNVITIDAGRVIGNMTFDASTGNYTFGSLGANGGNTLKLGSGFIGNITATAATGTTITFNAPLSMNGTTTFQYMGNATGSANFVLAGNITNTAASQLRILQPNGGNGTILVSGTISDGTGVTSMFLGDTPSSGGGNATVELTANNTYSGNTQLNFSSTGTLLASGTNSSSGTTTVQHGILNFNNADNGGIAHGTLILQVGSIMANTANSGNITSEVTQSNTFSAIGSQNIALLGNFSLIGSSRTFNNNITAGALTFANKVSLGNLTWTLAGTGNSVINGPVQDFLGGSSASPGNLTLSPTTTGVVNLNGNNTYTGITTISGTGVVVLNGKINSTGNVNLTGSTLQLGNATNGGLNSSSNLSFAGGTLQSLIIPRTLSNRIFIDAGTSTVSGTQELTFGNVTNRSTGTLAGSITGGNLTITNLHLSEAQGTGRVATIGGNSTTILNSVDDSFAGVSATPLTSGLTMNGVGGTAYLTSDNTYSGNTTVSNGVLVGLSSHSFGNTTLRLAAGGNISLRADANASFSTNTTNALYNVITSAGAATINVDALTSGNTGAKTITIGNITTSSVAAAYSVQLTGANNASLAFGNITGSASTAAGTDTINGNITGGGGITFANYKSANTTGNETVVFTGPGNVTVTGALIASATRLSATKAGTGTLTLNGVNTYTGATTINGGNVVLVSGGSLGNTAVAVNGGGGLKISGNYSIGVSAVGGGNLTVAGGATSATQGTLDLVDGLINTLTVQGATSATLLTLGSTTAGQNAILNLETGNSTVDAVTLANAGKMTLNLGGVTINLTGLGSLNSGAYNLINYASGSTFTGNFTLGTYTAPVGKSYYLLNTATAEQLIVSDTDTNAAIYWKGGTSAAWVGPNNFTSDAAGTIIAGTPASASNVYFTAASPSNLNTTLGGDFAINSLNFNATPGNVTIGGTNTLTINAANGYTDPVTSVVYAAGTGLVVQAGVTANHTISTKVALGGNQTWEIDNSAVNALTVSGVISGANMTLSKTGPGSLYLAAANTFSGGLNVKAGSVESDGTSVNAFGSGTITIGDTSGSNDATLAAYGAGTYTNNIVVASNGGNLTLLNANNFAGTTSSNTFSGTINLNHDLIVSAARSGRSITLSNIVSGSGFGLVIGSTANPNSSDSSSILLGGVFLTGNNTYTGATTINSGVLRLGSGGTSGSLSGAGAINNFATLIFNRSDTLTQGINFGDISGNGAVTHATAGTVVLNGNNTYTGQTTIAGGGLLQLGSATAISSNSLIFVGVLGSSTFGGTLDLNGFSSSSAFKTNASAITNSSSTAVTLSGNISMGQSGVGGTGNLTIGGVGDVSLTGNLSSPLVSAALIRKIDNNTLTIGGSGTGNLLTALEVISGNVILSKAGNTSLNSSAAGAPTTLTMDAGAGTVQFGANSGGNQLGDVNTIVINGGTLDMNGNSETIGSLTGSAGILTNTASGTTSTLTMSTSAQVNVYSGTVADGGGAVAIVSGTGGTLQLNGNNTFSGGTTVRGGTLSITNLGNATQSSLGVGNLTFSSTSTFDNTSGAAGTLGTNNAIFFGAATTATFTGTNDLVLTGDALLQGNNTNGINVTSRTLTLTGNISGGGTISKIQKGNAGTLALSGNNTFAGGLTVNSATGDNGTVALGSNTALGSGTVTLGGNIALRSTDSTARTISNAFGTFAGTNAVYTFGDSTGSANGNLSFTNTAIPSIGSGARTFAVYNTTTFAAGFSNTGSINKTGTGVMNLTGNSTYSGGTTITSGVLLANNTIGVGTGSATGTGNVTVASGGTLGGTGRAGSATGNVTVQSGGSIKPGSDANAGTIGRLRTGNLTLGGIYEASADLATASTVYPTSGPGTLNVKLSDTLVVTGNVTLGGTLVLDLIGSPTGSNNGVIVLIDNDGGDAVNGAFAAFSPINPSGGGSTLFSYTLYTTYDTVSGSFVTGNDVAVQFSSVPEPTSLSVLGLGMGGLLSRRRRRRK